MNMDALSMVRYGDINNLKEFMLENGIQHQTFSDTLMDLGTVIPRFPLIDVNPNDLEDWLLSHQVEHQAIASALNLNNPINLMDANWNVEASFYDWLGTHLSLHEQIVDALGL